MISTIVRIVALTLLVAPTSRAQTNNSINNSKIENSKVFQGPHTENNFNVNKNFYFVRPSKGEDRLEKIANQFSNENAERALKAKKYHLAAEILQEAFETATASKKSKKEIVALLSKKSIAEHHFDTSASYSTLEEALRLDKWNPTLLKAAAEVALDNYRFDLARIHLKKILNNQQIKDNPKTFRTLRFEANYILHAISALERKAEEAIEFSVVASKIYRTELTKEEQSEKKSDELVLLQVSLAAATSLTKFPEDFLAEYLAAHKIINPKRNPDYLGTDKSDVWISVKDKKAVQIKFESTAGQYDIFQEAQEVPEYILGASLKSIADSLIKLAEKKNEVKDFSERDMIRFILEFQESLIEVAIKCNKCSIAPLAHAIGSMMVGTAHESYFDYETAHFYYSLALRKIQQSNKYLLATPHYRVVQGELFKKIGTTRAENIGGVGGLTNANALLAPLERAINTFEQLNNEYPNQTDYISTLIELKNLYSLSLLRSFYSEKAEDQCKSVEELIERLKGNAYALDNNIAASYLSCTQLLLSNYKLDKKQDAYLEARTRFIDFMNKNYPSLDPTVLLGNQ